MELFKKYNIDFKSFIKKGVKSKYEPFGVFFITGYMGSGKTYFAVKYAYDLNPSYKIKTNIKTLQIVGRQIEYFERLEEIYEDFEEFTLYIIDEIGKKYPKNAKPDKDFYNWLQMSRKTKRIVFMIHQEYLQIPMWLRGVASEIFTTQKIFLLPLFKTLRGEPYLDDENMEWKVQYNYLYLYKRNKQIANLYNTFETVANL